MIYIMVNFNELFTGMDEGAVSFLRRLIGCKITNITFSEDFLTLEFDDVMEVTLEADEADCCAYKYLSCDDDVKSLVGARFAWMQNVGGVTKDTDGYDIHEWTFLKIQTDRAAITICAHNEHNGYYGGIEFNLYDANGIRMGGTDSW